jgi:predicted ATPase
LEGHLLGGVVDYERRGSDVRLFFTMNDGQKLPMEASSSLVRALSGLDLYLRHWANRGDLVILDEPEMNAHPDAQLGIVELLAYLVNNGVRVVVTTQSPYMVDHLGTLVEASRLEGDARRSIVGKLRLKDEQALISPDKLAVYRFGLDGKVTSIFDEETRSIDPSIFSEVGAREANLFSEILAAERRRGG